MTCTYGLQLAHASLYDLYSTAGYASDREHWTENYISSIGLAATRLNSARWQQANITVGLKDPELYFDVDVMAL